MATLTLGLTSGVVTGTRNYTLSDADVTRWIAALRVAHGLSESMTNGQVLAFWADNIVASAKRATRRVERDAAQRAASDAITDIDIT